MSHTSATAAKVVAWLFAWTLAFGFVGSPPAAPAAGRDVLFSATPTAAAARVDYGDVISTLGAQIPRVLDETGAVGLTIGLVDGDRTVWMAGFGYADREAGRKVTPDTGFHIGSSSKTMTAAAVMQLVQRGKVDLDAPITRYIPEFRLRDPAAAGAVTVRSIMTHHSGIPQDVLNLAEFGNKPDPGLYDKVVAQLATMPAERPVGEAWAYSNLGITMLQGVIENVSGRSFEDYTARHLFGPMGMPATSFDDASVSAKSLARNYAVTTDDDGTTLVVRMPREYINIRPAGSVVSTTRDMVQYLKTMIGFGRAPTGARILDAATVRQMITPQPASPWDLSFFKTGLVWWRGYTEPWTKEIVNHGGDTTFHHTMVAWLPKEGLGVFVSVNTLAPGNPTARVWMAAMSLMIEAKTGVPMPEADSTPAPPATPDPGAIAAAAGLYANSAGLVKVAADEDNLALTSPAQDPAANPVILSLRTDGWYSPVDGTGQPSFKPTVIRGQRALLRRTPGGFEALYAQAIPADYRIPPAWAARAGTYTYSGAEKNVLKAQSVQGMPATLAVVDGILMLDAAVLLPLGPRRAVTFGPTPAQVMRGAGISLEAIGDHLTFMGMRLVR